MVARFDESLQCYLYRNSSSSILDRIAVTANRFAFGHLWDAIEDMLLHILETADQFYKILKYG